MPKPAKFANVSTASMATRKREARDARPKALAAHLETIPADVLRVLRGEGTSDDANRLFRDTAFERQVESAKQEYWRLAIGVRQERERLRRNCGRAYVEMIEIFYAGHPLTHGGAPKLPDGSSAASAVAHAVAEATERLQQGFALKLQQAGLSRAEQGGALAGALMAMGYRYSEVMAIKAARTVGAAAARAVATESGRPLASVQRLAQRGRRARRAP